MNTKRRSLVLGFIFGIIFGFLLQKGGVTQYDVILGQLLLEDFTVLKVMITAAVTGMVGIYGMKALGWVELYPKAGSVGQNVIGGLIFGVGFAVLGYCPGTALGAVGSGHLDAAAGGLIGIVIGAGLYAEVYPRLSGGILRRGDYGDVTLPELLGLPDFAVVVPVALLLILALWGMESAGL